MGQRCEFKDLDGTYVCKYAVVNVKECPNFCSLDQPQVRDYDRRRLRP